MDDFGAIIKAISKSDFTKGLVPVNSIHNIYQRNKEAFYFFLDEQSNYQSIYLVKGLFGWRPRMSFNHKNMEPDPDKSEPFITLLLDMGKGKSVLFTAIHIADKLDNIKINNEKTIGFQKGALNRAFSFILLEKNIVWNLEAFNSQGQVIFSKSLNNEVIETMGNNNLFNLLKRFILNKKK